MEYWHNYHDRHFAFDSFPAGAMVLDVGFGDGDQMRDLERADVEAFGVDPIPSVGKQAKASGLKVSTAAAEHLPFAKGSFDGLICKVVLPYTDEARAIAEWGRVLKPGATAYAAYHGAGYYLRYVATGESYKLRIYGTRSLLNGWAYALTRRRLPGFMGDTIYQAEGRLQKYYDRAGLALEQTSGGARFGGYPVFIYHTLRKR